MSGTEGYKDLSKRTVGTLMKEVSAFSSEEIRKEADNMIRRTKNPVRIAIAKMAIRASGLLALVEYVFSDEFNEDEEEENAS